MRNISGVNVVSRVSSHERNQLCHSEKPPNVYGTYNLGDTFFQIVSKSKHAPNATIARLQEAIRSKRLKHNEKPS